MPKTFIAQATTTHFEMVHSNMEVIKQRRFELIHKIMSDIETFWIGSDDTDILKIEFGYGQFDSPEFFQTGEIQIKVEARVTTNKDIEQINKSVERLLKKR